MVQVEKEELENGGEIKVLEPLPRIQVGGGDPAFPSLMDAVKQKESKKDAKKKNKAVPLSVFQASKGPGVDNYDLPRAPRAKDASTEDSSGFRNGFKESYGRPRAGECRLSAE